MKTPEEWASPDHCGFTDQCGCDGVCKEQLPVIRAAMQAAIDAALRACENERAPDTGDDADIAHNHACDDCAAAIRAIEI